MAQQKVSNKKIAIVFFSALLVFFVIIPGIIAIPTQIEVHKMESDIRKTITLDNFATYIENKDIYLQTLDEYNNPTDICEGNFQDFGITLKGVAFSTVDDETLSRDIKNSDGRCIRMKSKEEQTSSYTAFRIYTVPQLIEMETNVSADDDWLGHHYPHYEYYHIPEEDWKTIFDQLNKYCKLDA